MLIVYDSNEYLSNVVGIPFTNYYLQKNKYISDKFLSNLYSYFSYSVSYFLKGRGTPENDNYYFLLYEN